MIKGILADERVNYKEAFQLLYWLEDHKDIFMKQQALYKKMKESLSDNNLDLIEAADIKNVLEAILKDYE